MSSVEEILISEFKAKCIAILRKVDATRQPVLITRRGRPIARIEPMPPGSVRDLGRLRGRMQIHGNIIETESSGDWEALNEPPA